MCDVSIWQDSTSIKINNSTLSNDQINNLKARRFFDGATIQIIDSNFGVYVADGNAGNEMGISSGVGNDIGIHSFQLNYVNDKIFTLNNGSQGLTNENFKGLYSCVSGKDPISYYMSFSFNALGRINGLISYSNNGSGVPVASSAIFYTYPPLFQGGAGQVMMGNNNSDQFSNNCDTRLFFLVISSSPYMVALLQSSGFQPHLCCTSSYLTNNTFQQVCNDQGYDVPLSASCQNVMLDYCAQGSNAASTDCIKYCQNNDVNCDNLYQTYCANALTVASNKVVDALTTNTFCGCFLPVPTMTNYWNSLADNGLLEAVGNKIPACSFQYCTTGGLYDYPHKQGQSQCPALNITSCISNLNITNNATIGSLTTSQQAACSTILNKGTGSGGTGTNNITTNQMYFYIVVGIALLILLIVVIVSVFSKPKSNINENPKQIRAVKK